MSFLKKFPKILCNITDGTAELNTILSLSILKQLRYQLKSSQNPFIIAVNPPLPTLLLNVDAFIDIGARMV